MFIWNQHHESCDGPVPSMRTRPSLTLLLLIERILMVYICVMQVIAWGRVCITRIWLKWLFMRPNIPESDLLRGPFGWKYHLFHVLEDKKSVFWCFDEGPLMDYLLPLFTFFYSIWAIWSLYAEMGIIPPDTVVDDLWPMDVQIGPFSLLSLAREGSMTLSVCNH